MTLSFLPFPSWELGRGLDAGRTAWFPYLPRSSRTLKELNGRESRSYCLFRFLFKKYKKTPEPMVWMTPATWLLPFVMEICCIKDCFLDWHLEAVHLQQQRTAVSPRNRKPRPGRRWSQVCLTLLFWGWLCQVLGSVAEVMAQPVLPSRTFCSDASGLGSVLSPWRPPALWLVRSWVVGLGFILRHN